MRDDQNPRMFRKVYSASEDLFYFYRPSATPCDPRLKKRSEVIFVVSNERLRILSSAEESLGISYRYFVGRVTMACAMSGGYARHAQMPADCAAGLAVSGDPHVIQDTS